MKPKIDLDKFVCSLVKRYYEKIRIDPITTKCWLDSVLEDQGLEYKDGEIVEIEQESEDEKIRNGLIALLKFGLEDGSAIAPGFNETKEQAIAWLEKQGEKKEINPTLQEKERMDDAFTKMMFKGKTALEAIHEEKVDNANKIEPKFHEGDWVVTSYGKVNQVITVDEDGDGFTLDDGTYFSGSWKDGYHLWSIKDAKEGDVLVNGSNIFIFHFIYDTRLMGYCHVNTYDRRFYDDLGKNECFCLIDAVVTPATKEQRDLLFVKMKEAGYEWDAEKKELKRIEEEYDGEDYGIDSLFHAQRILEKTLGKVDGYQTDDGILSHKCAISAVKKLYEKKPAKWSEEDEKMVKDIIAAIDTLYYHGMVNWLKSIKDRVQPQPTWSEDDENRMKKVMHILSLDGRISNEELKSLYDWLKSLKPQKPVEWSEEDEHEFQIIQKIIYDSDTSSTLANRLSNWLKSLKDRVQHQNRWKPSDEQMDNLSRAFNGATYHVSLLRELYMDLKKLKGE